MEYRKFGNLGFSVSTFGFGSMRLPTLENNKIDEQEAIKMVRYAIDNGVTYLDTAYIYHDGESERLLAKALKDGYREKVFLTTKLPTWLVNSEEDVFRLLDEQLQKLEVEYLDFYLVHTLNRALFAKTKEFKILEHLEKAKKLGKIKHIGFSFHDELDCFKEIVDYYNWEMCQIQLNILDNNYQAGLEGLKYAGARKIPVVIMEPLKGGSLSKTIPDSVKQIYDSYPKKLTPVEWAFKYVTNFEEVVTVLSGVSNMEQLKDNIRIFGNTSPNSLSDEDKKLLESVEKEYSSKIKVNCTGCNYCMPCPFNVNIPGVFKIYNDAAIYDYKENKQKYTDLKNEEKTSCVACGKCEQHCPQNIKIIERLKEAYSYF